LREGLPNDLYLPPEKKNKNVSILLKIREEPTKAEGAVTQTLQSV